MNYKVTLVGTAKGSSVYYLFDSLFHAEIFAARIKEALYGCRAKNSEHLFHSVVIDSLD